MARWAGKGPAAARSRAPTSGERGGARAGTTPSSPCLTAPSAGAEPGGPPGSGLRPARPAARLRQDQQASAHAATGPSEAPSASRPPARLPRGPARLGRSRSRAARRTVSLLPSARSSETWFGRPPLPSPPPPPRGLSARPSAGYSRLEGARAGSRAGREEGGEEAAVDAALAAPTSPQAARGSRARASEEGASERPPAGPPP